MSDEEFSISLRIWHPSAPANFVVDTVGLNPEIAQSVATPRVTPLGQHLEGTYKKHLLQLPPYTQTSRRLHRLSIKSAGGGGAAKIFFSKRVT